MDTEKERKHGPVIKELKKRMGIPEDGVRCWRRVAAEVSRMKTIIDDMKMKLLQYPSATNLWVIAAIVGVLFILHFVGLHQEYDRLRREKEAQAQCLWHLSMYGTSIVCI